MGTERKRKVSLFDVVDESKIAKINGGGFSSSAAAMSNSGSIIGGGNSSNPAINSWTGRPYSQRYYEILEKRRGLPVWHQKEEFLQVLKANQTLILVGETGSGKTTQVWSLFLFSIICLVAEKLEGKLMQVQRFAYQILRLKF